MVNMVIERDQMKDKNGRKKEERRDGGRENEEKGGREGKGEEKGEQYRNDLM